MKYLTLAADYMEFSLRDTQAELDSISDLHLPDELIDELKDWNSRYQSVIQMTAEERGREPANSLINELDFVGQELAKRIAEAIPGDAKVGYYSEGRLKIFNVIYRS